MASTPKYAVGEFERRFLVREVPASALAPRSIVDHYLDRSRLRLRLVEHPDGRVDRKLGHKRRTVEDDPRSIFHTSLYLDPSEFELLAALPGRPLTKTRLAVDLGRDPSPDGDEGGGNGTGSINVFEGDLQGLILFEVDLADRDILDSYTPPAWAGPEVTDDERFTGGWLAGRALADLRPAFDDLGWSIAEPA